MDVLVGIQDKEHQIYPLNDKFIFHSKTFFGYSRAWVNFEKMNYMVILELIFHRRLFIKL